MKRLLVFFGVLSLLASLAACGPIRAASATRGARDELYKARLAKADEIEKGKKYITQAQYQYRLATLYLEKSIELQGFAKYDAAFFYATKAAQLGTESVKNKAEEERRKIRREQIRAGKILNKQPD